MTSTGGVLRLDGELQNFHPSPTNLTRHTRHTVYPTPNLQVSHLWTVLAGALVRGRRARESAHYPAIGVSLTGEKDILGLCTGNGGEGARVWINVLIDLRNCGVMDTLFVICGCLKGLTEVVGNVRPKPSCRPASFT